MKIWAFLIVLAAASCSDVDESRTASDLGADFGEASDWGTQDGPDLTVTPDSGGLEGRDMGTASPDTGTSEPDVSERSCDDPFDPVASPAAQPPFQGTAYISNDLITESDPTAFVDLTYQGKGSRTMFDRRVAQFITVDAHLFAARFGTTRTIEVRVNPEFSQTDAETHARKFTTVIGRVPAFLLRDVDTISINDGVEDFGGGNRDLLIHAGQSATYEATGSLEEIFVHEASHTSMDGDHADNARWREAMAADGVAISTYARDNPDREDVAETVGPYLAARLRPDRLDATTRDTIEAAVPSRLRYLHCLDLSMDVIP